MRQPAGWGKSVTFFTSNQRLQWTQIIWVCPDIWVFSVLDNRHLADICAFCQKCQFEVRKAWNALFLQLKPHEMHCKQADSAILKIRCGWNYANCEYVLFAYGLLSYSDFKQTRAFVAKRDMSQIRAFSDFFWLRFDSDNCDLTQTLLRHLSQKIDWSLRFEYQLSWNLINAYQELNFFIFKYEVSYIAHLSLP